MEVEGVKEEVEEEGVKEEGVEVAEVEEEGVEEEGVEKEGVEEAQVSMMQSTRLINLSSKIGNNCKGEVREIWIDDQDQDPIQGVQLKSLLWL